MVKSLEESLRPETYLNLLKRKEFEEQELIELRIWAVEQVIKSLHNELAMREIARLAEQLVQYIRNGISDGVD